MKKHELVFYADLLSEVKERVRHGQQRAAVSANAGMIVTYWDVGRILTGRKQLEGWGAGVIPRLATDLRNELPEVKGYSETNLKRMAQFYCEYSELCSIGAQPVPQLESAENSTAGETTVREKRAQAVPRLLGLNSGDLTIFAQLSWSHNIVLMQKIKDLPTRSWYAWQASQQGWGRDALISQIKSEAHKRQGTAVTNFDGTLPEVHAVLANGLLKDPYLFDFMTLSKHFHERELETGLLTHIEKFLLELGRGFAFVGRQYELTVSDKEFYLDLLFYHLKLRCFVVVDLKKGEFKPEYAGKMNFYCSAVDDLLRHEHDQPTLGLILCQTKDRIIAEYSLRDVEKPIGVADYELTRALPEKLASSLPSIEAIEAELSQDLAEDES